MNRGTEAVAGTNPEPRRLLALGTWVKFYTPFNAGTSTAIVGPDLADYE